MRLQSLALSAGDTKLSEQLGFLMGASDLSNKCIRMRAMRAEGRAPIMTEDASKVLIDMKVSVDALERNLAKPSVKDAYLPLSANDIDSGVFHVGDLDNLLDPSRLGGALATAAKDEIAAWLEDWSKALVDVGSDIETRCPSGWLVVKDNLMADSNREVRQALLDNKGFCECSAATEKLAELLTVVKGMTASGSGPFFDSGLVREAKSKLVLGVETVSVTYALFQLTIEIPKATSVFERRNLIKRLRDDVQARGASFGASLEMLAKSLSAQAK